MTKSLKKPLSVEKEIEYLRFAMREPCGCKTCEDERANIGDNCVIRQALTAAHQAGIDEAVEAIGKQKPVIVNMLQEDSLFIRHGIDGVIGYNEAKKEIIKALQDNK